MSRDRPRIAIIGGGPVGIEAALAAAVLGFPFRLYERGQIAQHVHTWGHATPFSPFGRMTTPLGQATLKREQPHSRLPSESDILSGRGLRDAYWLPLAASPLLRDQLQTETAVLALGKQTGQPFRFLVRHAGKERIDQADIVFDCTGIDAQPRYVGVGGIPAIGELTARPHLAHGVEDIKGERRGHYADRTVLVIGAGHSAATNVCSLASLATDHPSTWVIWLARGSASQPIRRQVNDPLRQRDQLAARANNLATRGDGNVEFHPVSIVEEIQYHGPDTGFTVKATCDGKARSWQVDRIIANVGHEADPSLGMRLTGEAGYFVLGIKKRSAGFLLQQGHEQVRDVFAHLTGKPNLDLTTIKG